MKDTRSEDYDAVLVANARLHLSNVVNGNMSELFFDAMGEIIQRKVYLGYKTINGKQAKLRGIKDFFYNFHYGLGIKNLPEFLANCARLDADGKSRDGKIRKFIQWLHEEDPDSFEFPDSYWEFRRLRIAISKMSGSLEKKYHYLNLLKLIYLNAPEELRYIGPTRKYSSIPKAYKDVIKPHLKKVLTPIKLFQYPTAAEVEELARELYSRLDKYKVRVLIARLIEIYKLNDAIEKHLERGTSADDDSEI
jgi:hypothetical protein